MKSVIIFPSAFTFPKFYCHGSSAADSPLALFGLVGCIIVFNILLFSRVWERAEFMCAFNLPHLVKVEGDPSAFGKPPLLLESTATATPFLEGWLCGHTELRSV